MNVRMNYRHFASSHSFHQLIYVCLNAVLNVLQVTLIICDGCLIEEGKLIRFVGATFIDMRVLRVAAQPMSCIL